MVKISTLIFILLLNSQYAYSAACCGGASSLPNIITGDFDQQISASIDQSIVIGSSDYDSTVVFKDNPWSKQKQILNFSYAKLFRDYYQWGIKTKIIKNIEESQSYSSIGDTQIQFSYEFLPELHFSKWKPRGYVFSSLLLPTGSKYSGDTNLLETTGNGTYTLQIGLAFKKIIKKYDLISVVEIHQRSPNDLGTESINYALGTSITMGAGISPEKFNKWHFGTSIKLNYEGPQYSNISSSTSESYWMNWGLNCSYMLNDLNSLTLSYLDDTLLGPSKNQELNRSISFRYTLNSFL